MASCSTLEEHKPDKKCEVNRDRDDKNLAPTDPKTDASPQVTNGDTEPKPCTDVEYLEQRFRLMKFDEYDFTNDDQFQSGWKKLSEVVPAGETEKQLLRAKLFYYSKHIEPIDVDAYLAWKDKISETPAHSTSEDKTKGDNSSSPKDSTTEEEEVRLTFSEVMEFIQSGRDIPGVKKIEIQTTESDPSPSVLERKTKPWET